MQVERCILYYRLHRISVLVQISLGRLTNIVTFICIAAHLIVARIGNRNISIIVAFQLRTEFKVCYAQKSLACSALCDFSLLG